MSQGSHDTLVYRLAQTLVKLNQGEKLNPKSLADEFGVTLRTIQRDLNIRFAYLPIVKKNGLYHLDPIFLGKLSSLDIERFASLAGIQGLFPSLSQHFLREIFDNSAQSLLVKGHSFETLKNRETDFQQIDEAISNRRFISFDYKKENLTAPYSRISPYKMLNSNGIWYLAAMDGEKLKTFSFAKTSSITTLDETFSYSKEVESTITKEDGIWFSKDKVEVVLKVDKTVSHYFLRRKLVANQVIEKELEDGSLIISTKMGHENQVIPIIKYWIPHIYVISPSGLQRSLENELKNYIDTVH